MKPIFLFLSLLIISPSFGESLIAQAINKNDKNQLHQLISSKGKINEKLEDSSTPLLFAIKKNKKDMVEFLLSKNADVNLSDDEGVTPLIQAGTQNNYDLTKTLINKRADINAKASDGSTVLLYFAGAGNKDAVALLLKRGADPNTVNRDGTSPLRQAALSRQMPVFQLIQAKVSPKNTNEPMTPMFQAVYRGDKKKIMALLQSGQDINAANALNETALSWALKIENAEITNLLVSRGASAKDTSKQLYDALDKKQYDFAKQLIQMGCDVNIRGFYAYTPLLLAAKQGNAEMVKLLLEKGADINATEAEGYTPLMLAALEYHVKAVEQLLGAPGIDVNKVNRDGHTALSRCIDKSTPRAIYDLLLNAGAKPIAGAPGSNSDAIFVAEQKKCFELKSKLEKKQKE